MNDRPERRTYRKSPGRQYEDDYNPLRTQQTRGNSQSGRLDTSLSSNAQRPTTQETTPRTTTGRGSGPLAPRPDPRRTRQLMRQNILASKVRSEVLDAPQSPETDEPTFPKKRQNTNEEDRTLFRNRHPQNTRSGRLPVPTQPQFSDLTPLDVEEQWDNYELGVVDPDLGYDYDEEEDPLERRLGYPTASQSRTLAPRPASGHLPAPAERGGVSRRNTPPDYEDDLYEDFDDVEDDPRVKPRKKGVTRRKLLLGIGAVAVGGAAVAAYEYGPRLPQAISNVGTNIGHEVEDAFNRGVNAGADAARKEIINSLESLEGISLDAAMGAAKLTRVAYDVFVSPIVTFASTVVGDVLSVALKTVQTANGWLKYYGQSNATLESFVVVLQSWVNNAQKMPKQLKSITDSDLDGATTYLKGLQQKILEEKAKLNNSGSGGTPTPHPSPTATPRH